MGTPIGCKRKEPRKGLKRTTTLRKQSKKQAKRVRELAKIPPPLDGKCQKCGCSPDFRGLAKHHLTFRSHGGKDREDNLIWVCGKCHAEYHGIHEITA
jgi:5-methylcytosine-specific restriction endonuclease McrA